MSQVLTEINFVDPTKEGLDWDTDPSVIEVGNSRYRMCCRSKRSGKIENHLGNTLVNFTLPSGTNKAVLSCTNTTEDYIVWGIYNSLGNDIMLKYTIASNTVDIIVGAPNPLNFDPDNLPHNPKIIGDEIIYTEGHNEPRSFDLEKARLHTAGTGGYTVIDEQVIEAIKRPPIKAPDVEFGSDATISVNNLRGKMWQFAYRWVYDDNAKSVVSPVSKVLLPLGDELIDGSHFDDETVNNYIDINIETGHYIVDRIEILARDSNISMWFLVDVLDKAELQIPSLSTYDYRFFNNTNRIKVDQLDVNRLCDMLPERAKQQEIVNGEYLLYGNYLDGKDNTDVDAEITFEQEFLQLSTSSVVIPVTTVDPPAIPFGIRINLPSTFISGQLLMVNLYIKDSVTGSFPSWFNDQTSTTLYTSRYVVRTGDTKAIVKNALISAINKTIEDNFGPITSGIATGIATPYVNNDILILPSFVQTGPPAKSYYVTDLNARVYNTMPKSRAWKMGCYHQWGIVYSDLQGRLSNTNTLDTMKAYVRYWSQFEANITRNGVFPYHLAKYSINHIPPVWAHKAHIVYSKNLTALSHGQLLIKKTDFTYDGTLGCYRVKWNDTINTVNDMLINSIISTYAWTKGDRLRVMYKYDNKSLNLYTILKEFLDVEILKQDETTGEILIPNFNDYVYGLDSNFYGMLVEIYTPRKEAIETERFWEIAETIDILDPGTALRRHDGQIPNVSPAIGYINSGDCYVKWRFAEECIYPCESLLYSDFYESSDFDYGRPNITNKDAMQKWLISYYRSGGRKILSTKLNDFYRFDAEDFDSIGEMHGQITGLRQVGDTLKIYLENKCASQYIFRTSLVDVTGEESLQKSDKLFGTKRLSPFEYGCQDPGSIVVNDRYVYFLDAIRGVYCRDASNGIYPISSYKMVNFWKEKCEILRMNRGKYSITSAYNKDYNELNVTVVSDLDRQGVPYFDSFTILFMEEENRWKTFMPYLPELYGNIGGKLVSFDAGKLYLHDTNQTRNKFYGVKYDLIIDVFGNIPLKQNKVFDAIAIHANRPFSAPVKGDVYVYPSESYPDGMVSRLKSSKFELLEGVYYASFLKDMSDPAFTDELDALLNGRDLRGKVICVRLTNSDTSEVSLHFVTIKSTISEHTD